MPNATTKIAPIKTSPCGMVPPQQCKPAKRGFGVRLTFGERYFNLVAFPSIVLVQGPPSAELSKANV